MEEIFKPANKNLVIADAVKRAARSGDPEKSLNVLFSGIVQALRCERIYIFKRDPKTATYSCRYEWCFNPEDGKIDILQGFTEKQVANYYHYFNLGHTINFRTSEELKLKYPELYDILTPDGLQSAIVSQLMFAGKNIGFLGIDNLSPEQFDSLGFSFDLLTYLMAAIIYNQDIACSSK